MTLKLYVVADTMAQWYFRKCCRIRTVEREFHSTDLTPPSSTPPLTPPPCAPPLPCTEPAGNADPLLRPSAIRALRHGLTSSFGSVCFAALILAIIKLLRNAMNKAQQNADVSV